MPVTPLTPIQKAQWNSFLDYIDQQGYKGNPLLDDKNKNLGQFLMAKYAATHPGTTISYNDVSRVQAELQDYRTNLVAQYKKGQIAPDASVKSEDDIMPNLSPTDGWLGSKTSSHKFPVAMATTTTPDGKTNTTNFGTDVGKFDNYYLTGKSK